MTGRTPDGDGTFAPLAQDTFADPLSGLAGAGPQAGDEHPRLRVATPVQPDADAVRAMVNAALLAEQKNGDGNGAAPSSALPQPFTPGEVPVEQPLGMLPQQRTWPVRTPQILRQAKWPKGRAAAAEPVSDEDEEVPRKRPPSRRLPTLKLSKPSSNSAGVIVAVVLMIVFAIVAIQLLVSLFGSIAGIFS
ncbi:hypothetical protein SAMN05421504_102391 [Amycolatopsis xylanica]|uniref:Uncharacterized protein n=1 Tax=Amycolatopsis xylanica TaxID=589385 RepID=A0A1H2Z651_9PSEU|nr:hypothetical protein [Amycolatopsis xylanica]SDX12821.1 hypothetical protein SAMN05421504_102391 [Amycolatopsis xylanica]